MKNLLIRSRIAITGFKRCLPDLAREKQRTQTAPTGILQPGREPGNVNYLPECI